MFATTDLDIGDVLVHFGGNVVTDDELHHLLAQAVSTDGYVDSSGVSADQHLRCRCCHRGGHVPP